MATTQEFLPNYHVLEVSYVGMTDDSESKVRIKSARFEQSVDVPFGNEHGNTLDVARAWLEESGFAVVGQGEARNGYYLISTTFQPLSNEKE